VHVTPCSAATVPITSDAAALCRRAFNHQADPRLAWDPVLTQPADAEPPIDTSGSGPVHARPQEAAPPHSRPSADQDPSSRDDPHDAADQSPSNEAARTLERITAGRDAGSTHPGAAA